MVLHCTMSCNVVYYMIFAQSIPGLERRGSTADCRHPPQKRKRKGTWFRV